ncbi:GIY-YIG nuclease family protein [Salinibacter ruber]|uniref:GIY-YIG nuclease family protein n=1 Tax=Salinibacter ruber TaxID=146919 RepID=UPI0021670D5B|nr:GIY-YIG nuclease family protein [Salinibacter ruber]MCS4051309.1 putative RNA-binding Zn-ribbon protein involved in translation (DUF1610 family) [Salinibacter ruber]
MDLKSYTTERPEMEKPKTEKSEADEEERERKEMNATPSEEPKRDREDVDSDSWWGKKFVCKRCSVEKVTRTDVIDTSCPECGEEMTFWKAVKGKKDSGRDIHSKDQSTKDQSDGKEWWGEGRWWARWWALPLGLFLFEYALAVQLGVIDPGLGRIPQAQALLYVSLSAPVCVMYAWMLVKELENPLREWQEKPVQWGIALFILLIPVVLGVMYSVTSQGPAVKNSVLARTAIFEAIMSGFYFLWLTLLRLSSLEFNERSSSSWKRTPAGSSSGRKRKFRGYVYVATNPNIGGLVKIGYTKRTVEKRMKELSSSTGVPGRYKAKYKFKAVRPRQLERKVHRRLSSRRVEREGEFFKVSPKKAARVIKKVSG